MLGVPQGYYLRVFGHPDSLMKQLVVSEIIVGPEDRGLLSVPVMSLATGKRVFPAGTVFARLMLHCGKDIVWFDVQEGNIPGRD